MRYYRVERLMGAAIVGVLAHIASPAGCPAQDPAVSDDGSSYGFIRVTEGSVTLIQSDTGERTAVQGSEAILVGDEVFLSGSARAEIVLADRNVLRLGDRADVVFQALTASPDRSDRSTVLTLRRGSLQLEVPGDYLGDVPPAVEAPNAYIQLRGPGSYLIAAESETRALVVVRDGGADVRTDAGATLLAGGEELAIEGYGGERIYRAGARGLLALERWGRALSADVYDVEETYVEEPLRYAAAPMRRHGSWLYVRGVYAWRPYVSAGWRPYWHGRWRHTPTGLLWVSYEPWGWVPYHYGSWDYVPGHGWVWFPGGSFATAWVFWYWGPRYVGWVPAGYYSHHYGPRFRFRFGVYGWAGGYFGAFRDWCFVPVHRFGHHRQHRYTKTGRGLGKERGRLGRGIITTDTRRILPGHWQTPERVLRTLADEGRAQGNRKDLEDVSPFIYRHRDLPPAVEEVAMAGGNRGRDSRLVDRGPDLRRRTTGPQLPRAEVDDRNAGRVGSETRQAPRPRASIDPVRGTRALSTGDDARPSTRPRTADRAQRPRAERPLVNPRTAPRVIESPKGTVEPRSRRPTVEPRSTRPTVEPRAKRPTVEPRSARPTVEPRAKRPAVEPRAARPTVEPRSRRPTVEPRAKRPSAEPRAARPTVTRSRPERSSAGPRVKAPARSRAVTRSSASPRPQASRGGGSKPSARTSGSSRTKRSR